MEAMLFFWFVTVVVIFLIAKVFEVITTGTRFFK